MKLSPASQMAIGEAMYLEIDFLVIVVVDIRVAQRKRS
ncbi:hypothetical protein SLEP1_g45922 [Rubroshorea leprosula]|uniref:Uncharacterized protein n=1 Tax=Rubroshorea leprosula TaxID=152421 RepID=A0AAV5LN53_9ROSI|nr:hypothetical protein SLEP1_g45922 [Rubroshorea leprosula]